MIKLGQPKEAIEASDKTVEYKPDNSATWYIRARIYSILKDKSATLSTLAKAIKLFDGDKKKAKEDDTFKWLWADADFKKLTQ